MGTGFLSMKGGNLVTKKRITIIMVGMLISFFWMHHSLAENDVQVIVSKDRIQLEEEIEIKFQIADTKIATMVAEIYFDDSKLTYQKGPENANESHHRILSSWLSENGKNQSEMEMGSFTFQAKQEGIANVAILIEAYQENGEKVEIAPQYIQIPIGEETQEEKIETIQQENVSDNNANLSQLRLNHEGISPKFDVNIHEYYFIAEKGIESLEVTAISEHPDAKVEVTGNQNLKMGKNTITITVKSKDQTETNTYQIHVTRTDDIQLANANLETLAVRQVEFLTPEFAPDRTQYKIEVGTPIDSLDVLAIPEREKAKVGIVGQNEIKIGENEIVIEVIAEDGITSKKYHIMVHRRNEVEEMRYQQEQKAELEKLGALLEESKNQKDGEENENRESKKRTLIAIGVIILVGFLVAYKIYQKKRKKND